jgi:glycosyltransferase involved in cell wall biosynthesis
MKVFQHKKNLGGGPARNTCVLNSQGDLIFCLDSDNLLAQPDDIQELVDFLDREKVEVACFGILQFFEGDLHLTNQWEFSTPTGRYTPFDILKSCGNPAASGNYLFTRRSFDIIKGYSSSYVLDTFYFGFEQTCHGFFIAYLPGRCYLHRTSPNSYYVRGVKAGGLDQEFIQILLRHPEFFSLETLEFLSRAAKQGRFPNGWNYMYIVHHGLLDILRSG